MEVTFIENDDIKTLPNKISYCGWTFFLVIDVRPNETKIGYFAEEGGTENWSCFVECENINNDDLIQLHNDLIENGFVEDEQ